MKIVVDTNIVFSTLLNPHSEIGDLLMNLNHDVQFFAPSLLKEEIERYSDKIISYSKLTVSELQQVEGAVFSVIKLVPENDISDRSWGEAFEITGDVDENDTPFVALALEMRASLWTGDKVLADGLLKKGHKLTISTKELKSLLL